MHVVLTEDLATELDKAHQQNAHLLSLTNQHSTSDDRDSLSRKLTHLQNDKGEIFVWNRLCLYTVFIKLSDRCFYTVGFRWQEWHLTPPIPDAYSLIGLCRTDTEHLTEKFIDCRCQCLIGQQFMRRILTSTICNVFFFLMCVASLGTS